MASPLGPLKLRKEITKAALVKEIAVPDGWYHSATVAPDGRKLLLAGGGEIIVVDLVDGKSKSVIPKAVRRQTVSKVAFTPDGARVAAALGSGELVVLSWPTLSQIAVHKVSDESLHGVAVMPDGTSAWVGGDDRRTRIDLRTGKVLASHTEPKMWISDVAVSPDGKTLVTADSRKGIRICDARTGAQKKTARSDGSSYRIAVSRDQALVASLQISIVNLATGKVRKRLDGVHSLSASAAVFIDDGSLVASVGNHDAFFTIWDGTSGKPRLTLKPLKKGTFATVLVAGDNLVTVPRYVGPLQVWRAQALVDAARRIAM